MSQESSSYQNLHKPSSSFKSRDEYLNHELQILSPKRWRLNLPGKDYRVEWEDFVPGMAATIGKIVMVAAVVGAFAAPLGLSPEFVIETMRARSEDGWYPRRKELIEANIITE